MKYYKRIAGAAFLAAFAACAIALPIGVRAEGDTGVATAEEAVTEAGTIAELRAALADGGQVRLTADMEYSGTIVMRKDAVIDLNGHTVSLTGNGVFYSIGSSSEAVANVVITGEGKIVNDATAAYPVLYVGANSTMTLESGTIEATNYGVMASAGGAFTMNGGKISVGAQAYGIGAFANTTVTINGGEIRSGFFAIAGNGTAANAGAKFYINGGTIVSDDYAIYVPQVDGVLEITGGTIEGARGAIAANRGVIKVSGDATLISDGTAVSSGNVKQDGTRGYSNAVIGMAHEYDNVILEITGGKFVAKGDAMMIGDPANGYNTTYSYTAEISGGEFSELPELDMVALGYDVYDASPEGPYFVAAVTKVNVPEGTVYLARGEKIVVDAEWDAVAKEYATVDVDDEEGVLAQEGNTLTANAAGKVTVSVNLHNYKEPQSAEFEIAVYEIAEAEDDANEKGSGEEASNEAALTNLTGAAVNAIVANLDVIDESEGLVAVTLGNGTKMWVNPNTAKESLSEKIHAELLVSEKMSDDQIEDLDTINGKVAELGAEKVATFDYSVRLVSSKGLVAYVSEMPEAMKLTFDVSTVEKVADGYERTWKVVRMHEGVATALDAVEENGVISFASDKFSSYTIAYIDLAKSSDKGGAGATDSESAGTPETGAFTAAIFGNESSAEDAFAAITAFSGVMAVMLGVSGVVVYRSYKRKKFLKF